MPEPTAIEDVQVTDSEMSDVIVTEQPAESSTKKPDDKSGSNGAADETVTIDEVEFKVADFSKAIKAVKDGVDEIDVQGHVFKVDDVKNYLKDNEVYLKQQQASTVTIDDKELQREDIQKALDAADENAETVKIGDDEFKVSELQDAMKESSPEADQKIEIDGEEFTIADVKEWKEGGLRQSDYTRKAQELATERGTVDDQRKAVMPMIQLVEKIKGDNEFVTALTESIEDVFDADTAKLFKAVLAQDPTKVGNPFKDQLDKVTGDFNELWQRDAFTTEVASLRSAVKKEDKVDLNDEDVGKISDYAVKKFDETGRLLSLHDAYKLMNYKANAGTKPTPVKKPNPPNLVKKRRGAADFKKSDKPPKNIEDIDTSGFDLFED
ncbi:MAG: hypothetical protein H8E14_15185 [Candidatus Marinimicrobia bacterium]|nr:hypothetical protein [Candidatus Neomarinimicrobiota bacterium]